MSITLMTADQRAGIDYDLGATVPAAVLAVADTVTAATDVRSTGYSGAAVGRLLAADMLALAARLVAVEQILDTTRRTLARLAVDGDDYSVSDVLYELEQSGVGIRRAELDHAEAVIDAVGRAGAF